MRLVLACLSLLSLATIPVAAHADTVDVMTVTGEGHTWTFDFPTVETFTYPANLALFIPGLTPLSATLDGASIAPTEIFFHATQNISGPFGQIITPSGSLLDISSPSGPFTDPVTLQTYYAYTSTFFTGQTVFGTETVFSGGIFSTAPFTIVVNAQQQSTAPTPEPSGLILLATALIAMTAFLPRPMHNSLSKRRKGPPISLMS